MRKRTELLSLQEALQLDRRDISDIYKQYANPGLATMLGLVNFNKKFVKARGVNVWDDEGNEYLDFLGGYGALNFGHNHPQITDAVQKAAELPNLLQASLGTLYAALAYNLAQITPGELCRTFFGNSGAEAVEGALKLARGATGKTRFIHCEGSFHGKTFGALSVTGKSKYQDPFKPLLPGCEAVPFGDLNALEEKLKNKDVAAFIIEPIQGEGGVHLPEQGYLKGVRELCDRYDTLLIFDEIQTGFARTGTNFACQWETVVPDIMCLGKSLGGGVMPISAFITTEGIWDSAYGGMEKCSLHTSTFGGNARACAAGIASIEVMINEDLAEQARGKGAYLLQGLRDLQEKYPAMIKEVRGRGLLIGVEFNQMSDEGLFNKLTKGKINKLAEEYLASLIAGQLMNKYQIITAYTLNNPNVIRFEPPLIVSREQMDKLLAAMEDIFEHHSSMWSILLSTGKNILMK
ncbi:MAG: aspartate aminotransferase family protein [Syntrophaceticus sp.]|jgi:putrescine aminotransferase|nr:aspartate aminotransferase family protein [Syntrophaceticus sp.]MDD3314946.1 aspartate aminotransferase family protein [Syntrophaceticus sp.]MDD4359166.1 aspartate aminotransferase family protein [Syntrophaceticus sp.]MDD4782080.1 aspartate aminotransferase family protein [Syntrophaceticus sp.]